MKNNVFIVALMTLISVSAIAQDNKWSLKEAVDYALENNLQVQQTKLDFETAEQDVVTARGNFFAKFKWFSKPFVQFWIFYRTRW
jgi:outer membrane protein